MKTYLQINSNDCGISVTQSLFKYFYKKEISKEELYKYANISGDGMSILDLENLNKKFGIILTSYEMNFEEFKSYTTNDYFLLIIKKDEQQHYVIAKKYKNKVIIYDSEKGKISLSYEELQKLYLDIFISISYKEKIYSLSKTLDTEKEEYDLERIIQLFFVNLSVFVLSIITTFLMKYGFNHISNNYHWNSLKKIFLIIISVNAIYYFGEYLENLLIAKAKKDYSKELHENLLNSLLNKNPSFSGKLGNKQFLLLKNHIENIAIYHADYVNKWIINVIIFLVTSFFLINANFYCGILLICSVIIQYFFWNKFKKLQERFLPTIINLQNEEKRHIHDIDKFLNNEINREKLSNLVKNSNNAHSEEIIQNFNLSEENNKLTRLNHFINSFIYFAFLTFLSTEITFATLIIIGFFHNYINKSLNNLLGYYRFKPQYIYSKKIYHQLLTLDSIEISNESLSLPNSIYIRNLSYSSPKGVIFNKLNLNLQPNTFLYGPSGIGKTVLYKLISKKINSSNESIYFDDICTESINPFAFNNLIIYQVSNSVLSEINIPKILNSFNLEIQSKIEEICFLMNLNFMDENINFYSLSSGQKQLLNILNLLKYSGKILLLDEIASHINIENKTKIFEIIIPLISEKNFLICSEHCHDLKNLFPNSINLEEYVYSGK